MNTTAATVRLVTIGRSRTLHLEGLDYRGAYGPNAGSDTDSQGRELGYVAYVPTSACPTLSRALGSRSAITAVSETVETPTEMGKVRRTRVARKFTVAEALAYVAAVHGTVCTKCAAAAQAAA